MKYALILILISLIFSPDRVLASTTWAYPISNFAARPSYKSFGEYFDKKSYLGREDIFPNQFTGYHAAIDLEIFPTEGDQLVPVYAIANGKIVYASTVSGYGGVILLQLTGTDNTVIYGHVKTNDLPFKVGDLITGGSRLSYLGAAFSKETGGERKHLHFGIYKGKDLYFKGYEPTQSALENRWINPTAFLNQHISRIETISPVQPIVTIIPEYKKSPSLFTQFINAITSFIRSVI